MHARAKVQIHMNCKETVFDGVYCTLFVSRKKGFLTVFCRNPARRFLFS